MFTVARFPSMTAALSGNVICNVDADYVTVNGLYFMNIRSDKENEIMINVHARNVLKIAVGDVVNVYAAQDIPVIDDVVVEVGYIVKESCRWKEEELLELLFKRMKTTPCVPGCLLLFTPTLTFSGNKHGFIREGITNVTFVSNRQSIVIDYQQQRFDLSSLTGDAFSEVGGFSDEIDEMVKRCFVSRTLKISTTLGFRHQKGILLYGPPGTGKTLIAKCFAKALGTDCVVIVNAADMVSKWVGESEKHIQKLFTPAQDNPDKLHVLIIDEIDALCPSRGSSVSGAKDGIVNQFLTCLDGVKEINNLVIIAMTNRKDMIDPALLRPGRIECHILIGFPTEQGRVDIFNVHLRKLREAGRVSEDVDVSTLASMSSRKTGADIYGIVSNAVSHSMLRGKEDFILEMKDFGLSALKVQPIDIKLDNGIEWDVFVAGVRSFITKDIRGKRILLLSGKRESGKTTLAKMFADETGYPILSIVDAKMSVEKKTVIIDNVEDLIGYADLDGRYDHAEMRRIRDIVEMTPTVSSVIIITSSIPDIMSRLFHTHEQFKIPLCENVPMGVLLRHKALE